MSATKRQTSEQRLETFFATLSEELHGLLTRTPAIERQVQRARKKARFLREDLQDKAISEFIANNERIGLFVTNTPPSRCLDQEIVSNARYFITNVLERYTTTFDESAVQQPLEISYLHSHWRFGPGASNGISGTHTADKIWQDMTCTAPCEPLIHSIRRCNPYFMARDGHKGVRGTRIIEGSRLTTVPKNEDSRRTIAVEPSGNMILQLAAGHYLEGALRLIGLDIRSQQPKNRLMAQRGSIDGSVATLDLKAASDMISLDLVRALMPPSWYDLILKIRSPVIEVPANKTAGTGSMQLQLNMVSTMGNGFTFPLMTLIIVALIYGYRCTKGGPNLFISWKHTCVFGDDIIIPTHEYDGIVDTLEKAGFIINRDKSFREGSFRESCGGDFLNGVDITPFYVKKLETVLDVYVVINQLMDWSGREKLFLPRTMAYLKTLLDGKPHLVPEWMNANQGIRTSGCPRRYTYLSPVTEWQKLSDEYMLFGVPLAVGGYVVQTGSALFFLPRSNKPPRSKVRRLRLPTGYLSGWDPGYRSQPVSDFIATRVAMIF